MLGSFLDNLEDKHLAPSNEWWIGQTRKIKLKYLFRKARYVINIKQYETFRGNNLTIEQQ